MDTHVPDVHTVDEHLAFLHIIVAWDKVYKGRFAASRLSHKSHCLSLAHSEVDVSQNPFLGIAETYVAELYLVLERCRTDRAFLLRYVVFGFENLVDALHTGKSHRDCVACLGELFERIDYGIEDDHVVDECRSGQRHFVKHEDTTEPQDYDNHHCAENSDIG